jgi:iron complex outermembrane recepter protein
MTYAKVALLALLSSASSIPAMAQESASRLEEIVVTAQRRAENLQDVPISVTALSGETLNNAGVQSTLELRFAVPGMVFHDNGAGAHARIRGIGTSTNGPSYEDPIAFYVDGIYYGNNAGTTFPLTAVDRIEVLKGPQGTLFGRNATGGLINIITRDPAEEVEGELSGSYGNYGKWSIDGYAGGPLGQNIRANLSFRAAGQGDGYGTNLFNGQDIRKVKRDNILRGTLLFTPSDDTELRLSADYSDVANNLFVYRAFRGAGGGGLINVGGPQDANVDYPSNYELKGGGVSARATKRFDAFTLVGLAGYRSNKKVVTFDLDASPLSQVHVKNGEYNRNWSLELQIQSPSESKVSWVGGLYHFDYEGGWRPNQTRAFGNITGYNLSEMNTVSSAVFGQVTYPITDALHITGGARYTWEERDQSGTSISARFPKRTVDFERATWRLAIDYDISDDLMVYASYNTGFKSGGFNNGNFVDAPFSPETVTSYEAGVKSELFDHRLRLNGSVFYYEYNNLQVSTIINNAVVIRNGPAASARGAELDATAVITDKLELNGGVAWIDTKYEDFSNGICDFYTPPGPPTRVTGCNLTGNEFDRTPKFAATASLTYTTPLASGELKLNGAVSYNGGYYLTVSNVSSLEQDAYVLVNASARYTTGDERYWIEAFGTNLTDEDYIATMFPVTGRSLPSFFGEPRLYGVRVGVKY